MKKKKRGGGVTYKYNKKINIIKRLHKYNSFFFLFYFSGKIKNELYL